MAKKQTLVQKVTNWKVIIGIQLIASLVLIGLIFKLGALPMKYAIAVIVVVALLAVGTFFLMKPSKENNKGKSRNIIGKILSILLSILLLIGSLYIAQGDSTIDSITDAKTQTTRISVVVLKESQYQSISDLKNQEIELNPNVEKEKMKQAIDALKKEEPSLKFNEINEIPKLADDLYAKKTEAIYVNEAYFTLFEGNHPNFESETRIIHSYEIVEELKDFSEKAIVTEEAFSVYISGIDTYGKVSTVSRSDVNMIVTVNPKTKQVLMTSIPRDYFVPLANKNGTRDKLTHSGLAGIENTIKTVEDFMDIKINYYARVNFTSLIKMVDALGGITVDIPKDFRANADGSYFKKGVQVINGKQALAYSRERYAFSDGDGARGRHQQQVLEAMLNKMMSPRIITNYSKILKSIDGSFETNMKSTDITDLLQMQIDDMAQWTFIQKQLAGHGEMLTGGAYMPNHRLYYLVPNEDSILENHEAIVSVLNGEIIQ